MDLTVGSISGHIKNISIPAGMGLFFMSMFNLVDTYFAGWISTEALASLGICFPLFFLVGAVENGITAGSSALISNALGESAKNEARLYASQVLAFGICCGLIVTIVGRLAAPQLLQFLGAEGAYLELARSYIELIFSGSIFFILNASANAILLAHGNAKTMRNFLLIGLLLNCLLDPLFLYGGMGIPSMGLKGIALATVVVMIIGDFVIIGKVIRDGYLDGCRPRDFIPRLHLFKLILEQSVPAALNVMSIALGVFVTTYYVKEFGSEYVAAFTIGMRIQQLFLIPTFGMIIALISIIGQNNGARLFNRIEETITLSFKIGSAIILVGAIVIFFFPKYLISFFSSDAKVIAIGASFLKVAAFSSLAYMIMSLYNALLQGMKRPNFVFILGGARQIIAPITVFHIVVHILHLDIISLWISILCISWTAAVIAFLYGRYVLSEAKKVQ